MLKSWRSRTTLLLLPLAVIGAIVVAATLGGEIALSGPSTIPTPTPSGVEPAPDPSEPTPTPTPGNPQEAENYERDLPPNPPLTGPTTDFAPNLPQEEKGVVIVELSDGTFHFYLVPPDFPLEQVPIPSGARLYDVRSPTEIRGKYAPEDNTPKPNGN